MVFDNVLVGKLHRSIFREREKELLINFKLRPSISNFEVGLVRYKHEEFQSGFMSYICDTHPCIFLHVPETIV